METDNAFKNHRRVGRYVVQYSATSNTTTVSAEDYISPRVASALKDAYPDASVMVFSDIYIVSFPGEIEFGLAAAKVERYDA